MKQYYYITPNNEQKGPVEACMLASCGVDSNTMVWTEGMANWMPAGQIPDLAFYINTTSSGSSTSGSTPPPFNRAYSQQSSGQAGGNNNYGQSQTGGFNNYGQGPTGNASWTGSTNRMGGMNMSGGFSASKPDNNLIWAILSTIFCCLPTGIYAIILSLRVNDLYNQGDLIGAQQAANDAKRWALYGLIINIVLQLVYAGLFGLGILANFS